MRKKRLLVLGTAFCMTVCSVLQYNRSVLAQGIDANFDMLQSAPTEEEDWENLRLDMKWAEEQDEWGYWGTPLGNGLFGVKENGGVYEDVFVLNHTTFWSGDPEYRDMLYENGESGKGKPKEERAAAYEDFVNTLKEAYTAGISASERYSRMESLNAKTQNMWVSDEQSALLSMGRMRMTFPDLTSYTDYKRTLDLDKAISEVSFQKDGNAYLRETFISNPDNVMVTRITNENNSAMEMELNLTLHPNMEGKSDDNRVFVDEDNMEVVMTGRAPYDFPATSWAEDRGTLMEARAKVLLPKGGEVTVSGSGLKVSGADEIIVLYTCETSFKDVTTNPSDSGVDYEKNVRITLDHAQEKSYEDLLNAHLEEYRELFRRLWIDLEGESIQSAFGNEWISPREYAMDYQYARYLMISCERKNSVMPYSLFGMWCPDWTGINEGAYFLNENLEKTQTLKGPANLADSSDGQYNLISSWTQEETGQRTAQEIYGAEDRAWMMSHSTGIWAKSGMWVGEVEWGSWLSGGIWALDTLYDKYNYTQDITLLEKYYPILEGAAKFALSTLVEVDGVNGELKGYKVVAPAGSPEHWYWVGNTKVGFDIASACDTLLYYNLFQMLEKGAEELKRVGISYDEEFLERVKEARNQMMPMEMFIDENTGRMKEWYNEYPTGDEAHRHASHLLGFFLANTPTSRYDTPELYEAQVKELERWMNADGGAHPDRSLMAVRAGYEDFALSHLSIVGTEYGHDSVMQWTALANAIPETILDSRFDQINLMENLPSAWSSGSVKGIRARGGYQLSITWENGELTECIIDSPTGETPRVLYKGEPVVLSEDSRFTVNRGAISAEDLAYEVSDKLEGKYTEESKAVLQAAWDSEDAKVISKALLAMEPVLYLEREVTIETENNINVLIGRDSTLQLIAGSNKEDAQYLWSIEKTGGGSADQIATIDENGLVRAISGGQVTVTAKIKGEPHSKTSIDLLVEAETHEIKECIDDRDSRFTYHPDWLTWDEGKHKNGTITYSQGAGATAELTFEGSGFDFIGSSASHIGGFKVILDGEVLDECVASGDRGYAQVMYSRIALEDGEHTVIIEGLGNRIDMDAMDIYQSIPSRTDRKELADTYMQALNITEGSGTEEGWNAFVAARENALAVLNNFKAVQKEISETCEQLQTAIDNLDHTDPKPGIDTDVAALNQFIAVAEKLEEDQYTNDSVQALKDALEAAKETAEKENASKQEIRDAYNTLAEAMVFLVRTANKEELKNTLDKANEILENAEKYTDSSLENLQESRDAAQSVYDNDQAVQKDIEDAMKALIYEILEVRTRSIWNIFSNQGTTSFIKKEKDEDEKGENSFWRYC